MALRISRDWSREASESEPGGSVLGRLGAHARDRLADAVALPGRSQPLGVRLTDGLLGADWFGGGDAADWRAH